MPIEIVLQENDTKSFQNPMEADMRKAIEHFEGELIKLRTGRAHTSLIEDIQVVCYDQPPMPLKNLASLSAPESRLLSIQPWDKSIMPAIEKAIQTSELGVNPRNDGQVIWIQLPEMSSNRREELIKILGKKAEECRIALRNTRKDYKNLISDAKKNKTISENFFNRLSDVLQSVTEKFEKIVDDKSEKKKIDITTI